MKNSMKYSNTFSNQNVNDTKRAWIRNCSWIKYPSEWQTSHPPDRVFGKFEKKYAGFREKNRVLTSARDPRTQRWNTNLKSITDPRNLRSELWKFPKTHTWRGKEAKISKSVAYIHPQYLWTELGICSLCYYPATNLKAPGRRITVPTTPWEASCASHPSLQDHKAWTSTSR